MILSIYSAISLSIILLTSNVNAVALSRSGHISPHNHLPSRRLIPIGKRARGKRACTGISSTSNTTISGLSALANGNNNIAGLAWNNPQSDSMSDFAGKSVSWYYTWSPWPTDSGKRAGLQFVPMLWSAKQMGDFDRNKASYKAKGVTHILGFNEPNESGQANMSPADAIALWNSALMPMRAQGFKLVSPACSSSDNAITWYTQFLGGLSASQQPDAIAIHWYGTDVNEFIGYVKNIRAMFGKPIWVTEWSCQNFGGGPQCTSAQIYQFMSTALAFLRHTPWIERESWFGALRDMAGVNQLDSLWATTTVGDSTLSDIGWLYAYGTV